MSSKGLALSDILTKTGISQLIVGNEEDILFQKTCLLNEHVTYDKLTAFDKFMYVLGTICTSAQDMQRICKQFIEVNGKYAPLLTQEHDVRLALSLV
jgi:2-hydroxy-3-keto-5-methylthiopentenyl-1-phosphate phosphatase